VDADGRPIPWYTYPSIEYLRQFDFSQAAVFEYGSGNSSLFWAERAREVVSVEANPAWFDYVSKASSPNQTVLLRKQKNAYVGSLGQQGRLFDVIVIDGEWRLSCAAAAPSALTPGGMIVLDNSDWFPECARLLRAAGLFETDFSGFGPINSYTWTTSLFIQAPGRLQQGFRNPAPLGGIAQQADEDA
jgi:hypothetical protein